MSKNVTYNLDDTTIELIDSLKERKGISKASIIREAIALYNDVDNNIIIQYNTVLVDAIKKSLKKMSTELYKDIMKEVMQYNNTIQSEED